jgi:predicted RNase H-like nuclease (RuvC/YqgF family)
MSRRSSERMLYMGVDLESGEPGTSGARYSVVIIDYEGRIVEKLESASLARILRLAWEYRPAAIGTDNPYELAESQRDLARILELLPPGTRLVQVNVVEGRPVGLREAAVRAGLRVEQGKLTPGRTAYLAALLASRGYGAPLELVGERTIITVSRGRWSRSGGMSEDRYQRRIRASVRRAAEKVREALDRAGLDYDVVYRESEGGIDSAVFTVYAPRERLVGVVRPHRGVDYTISIRVAHRGEVRLAGSGAEKPQRPLIVGLDPGQTTGLAVIDLHGRVLLTTAGRGLDRGSIIEILESLGRPVIVAVDVDEVPEAVKKLAAQFNAELYHPDKPMSVAEKVNLASKALGGRLPSTTHERDALAAAYRAYLNLQSKLRHLDSYLSKFDFDLDPQRVKEAVIRGVTVAEAVERELERILNPPEAKPEPPRRQAEEAKECPVSMAERIHLLEAEVMRLRGEVERERRRAERLQVELEECRASTSRRLGRRPDTAALEAEARRLAERVSRLEAEASTLKNMLERLSTLALRAGRGEVLAARILPALTRSKLRESIEKDGPLREGEVIVVENPGHFDREVLDELEASGVRAVLLQGWRGGSLRLARELKKRTIPLLPLEDYLVDVVASHAFIDSSVLEDAEEWVRMVEEERARSLDLERIVREYREERARRGLPRRGV